MYFAKTLAFALKRPGNVAAAMPRTVRLRGGVQALRVDQANAGATFPPHPIPLPLGGGEGESFAGPEWVLAILSSILPIHP